jgi:carbamate kinase
VDAAIRFVEGGGRCAIVTSLDQAVPALRGETGTHIVPDEWVDAPSAAAPVAGIAGAGA